MTIIQDRIEDVAGDGSVLSVAFNIPTIRESADGDAIVSEESRRFTLDDGDLLTTDLDPGPAKVRINGDTYRIVIPDSPTPVRLWPLIDAGLPTPAPSTPGFVRSDDASRLLVMPTAQFNDLPVLDPMTMYATYDV